MLRRNDYLQAMGIDRKAGRLQRWWGDRYGLDEQPECQNNGFAAAHA